jgi:hypothetical protein
VNEVKLNTKSLSHFPISAFERGCVQEVGLLEEGQVFETRGNEIQGREKNGVTLEKSRTNISFIKI